MTTLITPALDRAIGEILLDNGCARIGRPPVAEQVRIIKDLLLVEDHTEAELLTADVELAKLSEHDLFELCCGEIGIVETTETTGDVLRHAFEAMS